MKMNENRVKEILNGVLADICDKTEMSKEDYLAWLELEIGMSKAEMAELDREGLFPTPLDVKEL